MAQDNPVGGIFGKLREIIVGPTSRKVRVLSNPGGAAVRVGRTIVGTRTPVVLRLNLAALDQVVIRTGSQQMRGSACQFLPPKEDIDMLACVFPR
jgi:hypothetical protein